MDLPDLSIYVLLIILLCLSAFFSACEMALASVNRVRMKTMADDGNKKAKKVLSLIDAFDRTLSAILVGNNIVNITAASVGTLIATKLFGASGVAISTAVMTVLVLIFGEVTPKSLAKENPERFSLAFCGVLSALVFILRPVTAFFSLLRKVISKSYGNKETQPLVTEEELLSILETIEEEGVIDEQRSELMQSALAFDETTVQEVLTPRVDLAAINVDDTPEKIRGIILGERFSRMPVFEKTLDNIIGILHTRDYLEKALEGGEIDIKPLLAKPLFVHKTQKIAKLLNRFKKERVHIAVVIDDFGGTMGIVSMEDLLEEIVGEIYDEDEEAEVEFAEIEPYTYEIAGDFPIEDALEKIGYFEKNFESEYSSVGGWAFEKLGCIPSVGDEFEYNGINTTIDAMEDQRVVRLTMKYVPAEDSE